MARPKTPTTFDILRQVPHKTTKGQIMPLVSVVIPAYNCSLFIGETIRSILSQGTDSLEIIVINDGSTDDTATIARGFGGAVRVIDQGNAGVCVARNRGLREAKGEFIAFVDHDDYWYPVKLAGQLEAFKSNPNVDVVFTSFTWWRPSNDGNYPEPKVYLQDAKPQGIDPEFTGWIYHQMLLDSQILTSTALARTRVAVACGGFDESLPFSEDWDFWLRLSRGSQFLKLKEATTLYRQHSQQGSRVIRPIDYRTQLLKSAWKKWGLASADGRCVSPKKFKRQLAKYRIAFGLGHLKTDVGASRLIAAKAFLNAFTIDPTYLRSLVYLAAASIGWKPKW